MREITKELHGRLEKYTDDDDMENKENLQKELNKKSGNIRELETRIKELESQLEMAKEETRLLQETVHNECLERHELHEKLEEARDELLELKKNACKLLSHFLIEELFKTNFTVSVNGPRIFWTVAVNH